jgi:hypothetical protein
MILRQLARMEAIVERVWVVRLGRAAIEEERRCRGAGEGGQSCRVFSERNAENCHRLSAPTACIFTLRCRAIALLNIFSLPKSYLRILSD